MAVLAANSQAANVMIVAKLNRLGECDIGTGAIRGFGECATYGENAG
jgi:hypothetical protein